MRMLKLYQAVEPCILPLCQSIVIVGMCRNLEIMFGINGVFLALEFLLIGTISGIIDMVREKRWEREGLTELERRMYR